MDRSVKFVRSAAMDRQHSPAVIAADLLSLGGIASVAILMFGMSQAVGREQPQAAPAVQAPFRLMTVERDRAFRALMPKLEDDEVEAILHDPRTILYTEREVPRAYQQWDGALPGIHSAYYNISADRSEPFGNANREFPWGTPAGTHRCKNVHSFVAMHLPRDEAGKTIPIAYYSKVFRGDTHPGVAWLFPQGTIFFEVLYLRADDGRDYTFEIRRRERRKSEWTVEVYRPFPTSDALAAALRELEGEVSQEMQMAIKAASGAAKPFQRVVQTLSDRQPGTAIFRERAVVETLPEMSLKLSTYLLRNVPFKASAGYAWRSDSLGDTHAPTAGGTGIVPVNYDAGFIAVDSQSCMRCHDTTLAHVNAFNRPRDWYGRVRGSDGIFSFHPFDRSAISANGSGRGIVIRSDLEAAGVVRQYNPATDKDAYKLIPGLEQ